MSRDGQIYAAKLGDPELTARLLGVRIMQAEFEGHEDESERLMQEARDALIADGLPDDDVETLIVRLVTALDRRDYLYARDLAREQKRRQHERQWRRPA